MGRKLLVADDSVTIQKVIKLALSSEGYDILAVSEGKEAIRAIQDERPDVVLIDVTLPGADAVAVKKAINQNPALSHVGFILMASAFEKIDEKSILEIGFHGRLIKPFDPSHLRKAVSDLMGKISNAPTPAAAAAFTPPPSNETKIPAFTPPSLDDDLPPVQDMHPTLPEPSPTKITEAEFQSPSDYETRSEFTPIAIQTTTAPPPPPPPASEVSEHDLSDEDEEKTDTKLESDIKDLTESTIKLSGLDEFHWNLDDSKKLKTTAAAPPAPPPQSPVNASPANEYTREITRPISISTKGDPSRNPVAKPVKAIDDGGSSFPLSRGPGDKTGPIPMPPKSEITSTIKMPPPGSDLISGRDFSGNLPPVADVPSIEIPSAPKAEASAGRSTLPVSRAEIEAIVRKDLEAAIERLAKDVVPQIAEAIIRREIEKILSEP